jgi:hypothetical protein
MIENREQQAAEIAERLADDAYLAWLSAESESGHALRAWCEAGNASAAYFAYRAALDREEAAALDLQRLCELAAPYRMHLVRGQQGRSWVTKA